MMLRVLLVVALSLATLPCARADVDLSQQVEIERFLSRSYIDALLALQRSQQLILASQSLLQAVQIEAHSEISQPQHSDWREREAAEAINPVYYPEQYAQVIDDDDSEDFELPAQNNHVSAVFAGFEPDSVDVTSNGSVFGDVSEEVDDEDEEDEEDDDDKYDPEDDEDDEDEVEQERVQLPSVKTEDPAQEVQQPLSTYSTSTGPAQQDIVVFGDEEDSTPFITSVSPKKVEETVVFGDDEDAYGVSFSPQSVQDKLYTLSVEDDEEEESEETRRAKVAFIETDSTSQTPQDSAHFRVMYAFTMLHANKLRYYEHVFKSSDVSKDFWMDRAIQLTVQSAGETATPEILQLIFVKLYRTNLETIKLSLAFQSASHFNSWLEDELDVYGEHPTDALRVATLLDQADDLIRGRLFAFSSFNSFAQIELQTFMFDLYLESILSAGRVTNQNAAPEEVTSFLQAGVNTQFTDILATGSFGAGAQAAPNLFPKIYKFYNLLFQVYNAYTCLSSAYADQQAYAIYNDGDPSNDNLGVGAAATGAQMLSSCATNQLYSAQMEYVHNMYKLFTLFSPILAGSFGGSLAGSLASL